MNEEWGVNRASTEVMEDVMSPINVVYTSASHSVSPTASFHFHRSSRYPFAVSSRRISLRF